MSVVVLEFGSQYTPLIARRLRELNAHAVILPGTAAVEEIQLEAPQALVLSGGPRSVFDQAAPKPDPGIFSLDLPILGICYGMHLLARQFGGRVERGDRHEYGRAELTQIRGPLFDSLSQPLQVWMSHADIVREPPPGWVIAARTSETPIAAIVAPDGRMSGVQFHPEVVHTPAGKEIFENFIVSAGVGRDWTAERILDRLLHQTEEQVGRGRVLLAVSGGVDSSALALLLARVGLDHTAVFVDHGLLRQGERAEVEQALRSLGVNLVTVDASKRFIDALSGVGDPEEKRKIIGRAFIAVFMEEAEKCGPFQFLAQGTLYPDVIESAGTGVGTANIKSHHNVGGLPEELGFELVEPFNELFKDEVREVARLLGLPSAIRLRHPFPGPGLAVRILGEVTKEKLEILRQADVLFIQSLKDWHLYDEVWQALAVLTPSRSVGVAGDERRYGYVLGLRAVTSVDGMTADWARLPHEFLDAVAAKITRQIPKIGRVVYDVTSKPPATIEWE
jgi:GMP synthase (glutamine-hydrolysing)